MATKHICPCGLNCLDCLFYKPEIYEAAEKLKEVIETNEFDTFLRMISSNYSWGVGKLFEMDQDKTGQEVYKYFESFKQMPMFLNILNNIVKLQCKKTCQEAGGCSIGGVVHKCDLLKCMESKGYKGCWECSDFEDCDKLKLREKAYGKSIQCNLKTIKSNGAEAVKPRGKSYYVWNDR